MADERVSPRVAILADDLIWVDRLVRATAAAGATPRSVGSLQSLTSAVADGMADAVIVDLTARAYDGLDAVRIAAEAGVAVLAVGQHDDHALRKRALAAGADRVLAYRKLHEDGPASIAAFLERQVAAAASPR